MDPYSSDPRVALAARCPRCCTTAYAGTGGWSTCTACGHSWPVHPHEVPADPEPADVLGAAALPVERMRRFMRAPETPAERAAARRFLDGLAEGRWRTR